MVDISHIFDFDNLDDDSQEDMATFKGLVPGSLEAKKLWAKVEQQATSPANASKAKLLSGSEKAIGIYKDRPLVPGEAGKSQGDFSFLVDKLHYHNGYSLDAAKKIAGKVRWRLEG